MFIRNFIVMYAVTGQVHRENVREITSADRRPCRER